MARGLVASRVGSRDAAIHLATARGPAASGPRAVVPAGQDRSAVPVVSKAAAAQHGRARGPAAGGQAARAQASPEPIEGASKLPDPTAGRRAAGPSGPDRADPAGSAAAAGRAVSASPARGLAGRVRAVSGRTDGVRMSKAERPIARAALPAPPGASGRLATRGRRGRPDPSAPPAPGLVRASERGRRTAAGHGRRKRHVPTGKPGSARGPASTRAVASARDPGRATAFVGRAALLALGPAPRIAAGKARAPSSARGADHDAPVSGSAARRSRARLANPRSRRPTRPAERHGSRQPAIPGPRPIPPPSHRRALARPALGRPGSLQDPTIAPGRAASSIAVRSDPPAPPVPRGRGRRPAPRRRISSAKMRSWWPAAIPSKRHS